MAQTRLIIVSNRLPVTIKEISGKLQFERAIGGVATTLDSVSERFKATWVGWSGLPKVLSQDKITQAGLPRNFVAVQADVNLMRRYYDRFANQLLWPTMHSMFTQFMPDTKDWAAYKEMNRRFAEAVAPLVQGSSDLIWVHDYHLMLLPQYLRQMGIQNRIGFFLHTPFPATEFVFGIPHAQELLAGICSANVLGFQTQRDVDNFWQCFESADGLPEPGLAGAFPIGTDYEAYSRAKSRDGVRQLVKHRQRHTNGKRVIFSLSRLDYTKGIISQLMAVQRFLSRHPAPEKLMYKLVVAPSREHIGEYKELKTRISRAVQRINKRLGTRHWKPIDYTYENLGFDEVVAWYRASDTLLLLPEMDGMNLVAKEYIAARSEQGGTLVLSTAMGSAEQLTEALLVDARDTEAAAIALENAHAMSKSERAGRWQALLATVRDQDVFWWADRFLNTLVTS